MVNESNTEKKSIVSRKNGPGRSYLPVTDAEEPHTTQVKPGPVITNLCISLLVMALFVACFHPLP